MHAVSYTHLDVYKRQVVHPLIHNIKRPFNGMKMGYRIFSQYGNIIGKDHFRKSDVYKRQGLFMLAKQRKKRYNK